MKKIFAICMIVVMLVAMSVNAFAATNGFVSSPSENPGPKVEDFKPSDEACTATLNITAYGDKHTLPEALCTLLEQAYDSIADSTALTDLNTALADLVSKKGYDSAKLAVADLFDIHPSDCDFHDGHMDFDVTLSADTLSHFVALLHMNKNGEWELVDNAKVTNNGEHLEFSVDSFSPFAIVVNTDEVAPGAGTIIGNGNLVIIIAVVVACAVVAVVFVVQKNKKRA